MAEQTGDRAVLDALIEGKSDEEITNTVQQAGYDTVLEPIFTGMAAAFLPDKNGGRNAVIVYDISTPDGQERYEVVVQDGTCTTSKGGDKEATVTLALNLPDFLKLMAGKLNGVTAFMSGKLKIKGDMMLAQSMSTWFAQ